MRVERKAETNVKQGAAFFPDRNTNASPRFYVDGLGFQMTNQWMHEGRLRWCSLKLYDVNLMLQEFCSEGHHRNLPDGKVGVGVSIYFDCVDALAPYRLDAKRPFVGNGLWNVGIKDPDGYDLSFGSPTDAPEESEYTE